MIDQKINKLPVIIINRRKYKHISQFSESANTLRQRIFRKVKGGNEIRGYNLPAGWWLPVK